MDILQYIPHGKGNAITSRELGKLLGIHERTAREEMKRLVRKGVPIMSSSQGKGYWITDDWDEVGAFLKEHENRVKTERLNVAELKRRYDEHMGYEVIKVKEHTRKIRKKSSVDGQIRFTGA